MRFTITTLISLAALTVALPQLQPNNAGARNVGLGDGSQFITGGCINNADCASGCCAQLGIVGICSAEAAAFQNGKSGCDFCDPNAEATLAAADEQVAKQGFKRDVSVKRNPRFRC